MDVIIPTQLCETSRHYGSYWPLQIIEWIQMIFAFLTLIVEILLIYNFYMKKMAFHGNFLIVLAGAGVIYFVHSITILGNHLYYQSNFHIFNNECPTVLIRWKCLIARGFGMATVFGFSFVHLALFLERACATIFFHAYEKASKKYGVSLIFIFLIILVVWSYFVYKDDDLSAYSDYCLATVSTSAQKLLSSFYAMLGMDFCCTIGDFWLLHLSKQRIAQKSTANRVIKNNEQSNKMFQLSRSYQLRENQVTTALVFPFAVTHSSFFLIYLILTTLARSFFDITTQRLQSVASIEGAHVTACVYTFASMLMLYILYNRLYKQKSSWQGRAVSPTKEADLYFKLFADQIKA